MYGREIDDELNEVAINGESIARSFVRRIRIVGKSQDRAKIGEKGSIRSFMRKSGRIGRRPGTESATNNRCAHRGFVRRSSL